ncbi:hypothetical protein [Devosia sp. 2618]|uniref:hypothetical protein n=1 Tax=Devosia sp. 2618 TaxID=3156454 RepID=UPI00339A5670
MNRLVAATALCLSLTLPAMADGKIYVQLPDLSSYTGKQAEDFLYQVVLANVVASNCEGYEVTDEEWSLLTDSADLLAYGQLNLNSNSYDDDYYKPAFDALDEATTCQAEGPAVEAILEDLESHGGSRVALPDQDAAYVEWRALMDKLQAQANGEQPAAPTGKTKQK